jgi:hypothetical protein
VLFLAVYVSGWAPAPINTIATSALLTVFLPQFLVSYKLGGFSPDVGSMPTIIELTITSYILAFPFSVLYALLVRRITQRIRHRRQVRDGSHARI